MDWSKLLQEGLRGLEPDKDLSVADWAELYRYIAEGTSAEPGKWRNNRTPYLVAIMDALSHQSPAKKVVFLKGAQIAGTEAGINWLLSVIFRGGGSCMVVLPTVELARAYSKERLAANITASPVLRGKVVEARAKDSDTTIMSKAFTGGRISLTGANSAASLRMRPVKNLLLEEVDAYPIDVGGEGNPVELAEKRTLTFPNRKIFMPCTPTDKHDSRIWFEWERSNKSRYFVPCPHCGHMQTLEFERLKWDQHVDYRLVGPVLYKCADCERLIPEQHKQEMLQAGEWRAEFPEREEIAGFWLNGLYSPFNPWTAIAQEFLLTKKTRDKSRLKAFVNTILGKPWEEDSEESTPAEALMARREDLTVLPQAVGVITAGIDVQDDRIELTVWGWAEFEEGWAIDHRILRGSPAGTQVWQDLEDALGEVYLHESGNRLRILAGCIDTGGHHTQRVYDWVKKRGQHKRIWAIKGSNQPGRPAIDKPSKRNKGKVDLYPVGTDTIKEALFYALKHKSSGPGYLHFARGLGEEYFLGLVSERRQRTYDKGVEKIKWVKVRERNEPLDCAVYAYAALVNCAVSWRAVQARLRPKVAVEPEAEEAKTPKRRPGVKRPRRGGGGWLGD